MYAISSFAVRQRHVHRGSVTLLTSSLAAIVVIVLVNLGAAADAPPDPAIHQLIRELAAAGEFSPAIALAKSAGTLAERDTLLAWIAYQQYRAGARDAALTTTSEIDNETLRAQPYKDLHGAAKQADARGGGSQADFESLIELITSTVRPTSWDTVGGPGSIKGFEGGVHVDADGLLKRLAKDERHMLPQLGGLDDLKNAAQHSSGNTDARRRSSLRKVSLTQLEREVQRHLEAGERLPDEMLFLAGLERVRYVLVYPDTHEIILAGPAGDWQADAEGRVINVESGHPVVQLDDLVVILRHTWTQRDARFGCSIDPTKEGLQNAQAFATESAKTPLKPGQRDAWLKQLAGKVGKQNVTIYGIDPQTRAGRVLVEADYRMKLVGLGLEESVFGVQSYLDSIHVEKGKAPPSLDLIRWWFTLNYDAIRATKERDAFELRGQGVQVQSENEFLNAQGQRVATGDSEPLNRQFAESFTKHFADLAKKYPIYADLQNLFDLALVSALLKAEDVPNRANWHGGCFLDAAEYRVPLSAAPRNVDTVINHRVINQVNIVAVVSGGVRVDPSKLVEPSAIETETKNVVSAVKNSAARTNQAKHAWWWD